MSDSANPSSAVKRLTGVKRVLMGIISRIIRIWQASLVYEGADLFREIFHHEESGALILLWHNRILPAIGGFNHVGMGDKQVYTIASASRDGANITAYLETMGIRVVRGSSSRRGAPAARELHRILGEGNHVAITLDGPRGPVYVAQPGAAFLMQLTGAPAYVLGVEAEDCWEARSWDRFMLPKPFSRVRLKTVRLTLPEMEDRKLQRQELERLIQESMVAVTRDTHRNK